jgi:phosphate starvation-inducible PhoH-like protein
MKMFLTRMGMRSKIVVNGDTTQVDLPEGLTSGLLHAEKVVGGIPGVGRVQLSGADIVRHPLVKRIVDAYERIEPRRRP